MSNKIRILKNFTALLSLRGLEFLIPLFTLPYLLRTIGVEKYGLIGFGYAFGAYFGAIVQYGFSVTATRDIARNRDNAEAIGKFYSVTFFSSLVLVVFSLLVAACVIFSFSSLRELWFLLLLSLMQALMQSIFPVWFFQGMERMKYIAYLNFCSKIIFVICLLIFIHEPEDYIYVPILNVAAALSLLLGSFWIVKSVFQVKIVQPAWAEILKTLSAGRHSFVNQFAPNLYNNSVVFILGLLSGGHAVGVYSAANKVVDAVNSVGYVLSNTFLPFLSRSIDNHGKFKRVMLLAGFCGTAFVWLSSDFIGYLLHTEDGSAIAELMRISSVGIFMVSSMLCFGTNFLMLKNKEAVAGKISLYTSLLFFIVALVLVPRYGPVGGVVTLVGARTTMAALFYINYLQIKLHETKL